MLLNIKADSSDSKIIILGLRLKINLSALISFMHEKGVGLNISCISALIFSALVPWTELTWYMNWRQIQLCGKKREKECVGTNHGKFFFVLSGIL